MDTPRERRRILGPTIAILLALNLGWLARLEVQAQQTNKLVEHHASLEKGADELIGLSKFSRMVGDVAIHLNEQGFSTGGKRTSVWAGDDFVVLHTHAAPQTAIELSEDPSRGIRLRFRDQDIVELNREGFGGRVGKGARGIAFLFDGTNGIASINSLPVGDSSARWGGFHLNHDQGVDISFGGSSVEVAGPDHPTKARGVVNLESISDIRLKARGDIILETVEGEIRLDGRRIHLNERRGS